MQHAGLKTNGTSGNGISWNGNGSSDWLDLDGTLKVEHYISNGNGCHQGGREHFPRLRSFWSRNLVAPMFLGVMVSIILFLPKKILRSKSVPFGALRLLKKLLKRGVDVIGALVGLCVSILALFFLPLLIKLDSEGSAVFRQRRVGRNRRRNDRRAFAVKVPLERRSGSRRKEDLLGQPFEVYKFRSMKQNAEMKTGPIWATSDDPRITKLGRFMRPYHLDEIPQFINVLKGEMSLVGPRPERPEFVHKLKSKVPEYARRFMRRPGLTGLAQINCGYDTSIADVARKLKFDLEYVRRVDLIRDLWILLGTLKKIVSGPKQHNGGS